MSDERKPNIKERKFARVYAKTGDSSLALEQAGYNPKSKAVADVMASQLRARPQVQREIDKAFESFWPDADQNLVQKLQQHMNNPEIRTGDFVKIAELIIKMKGHAAPTKHQRLVATVKTPLPLPGQGEDGE